MKQANVLILDFEPTQSLGGILQRIIRSSSNFDIEVNHKISDELNPALENNELLKNILQHTPDLIILVTLSANYEASKKIIEIIRNEYQTLPLVIVIEETNADTVFSLIDAGATDFIMPPFKDADVMARIRRLMEQSKRRSLLLYNLKEKIGLKQLIGEHPLFLDAINKIPRIAQCDTNVIIRGETGTGKELCARAIHYLSPRADRPFIPVNCGAIPADLVENELFGHVQGAYTGAHVDQKGIIHESTGGTLFMDEIDCLPLSAQVKLLRLLQNKEYRQLGSAKTVRADIRIIAASNSDLEQSVKMQNFRQDLYYRLNILPLTLPPLRERKMDIPLLANHFLEVCSQGLQKHIKQITREAMQKLLMYDWPGNVRELENVIERAVVLALKETIDSPDIILSSREPSEQLETFKEAKARAINKFEIEYIQKLLLSNQGNISKAARAAQKNRRAFWELIRKHNIDIQNFKPHRF